MTTFHLPDLGEGLAEAEIVAWHVKEGDDVHVDQPMMSVETAKAVVEVPSPFTGKITKLYADKGDIVGTGKPLVDFELAPGSTYTAPPPAAPAAATVVGFMPVSDKEWVESSTTTSTSNRPSSQFRQRVRAAPSVRMLAKRLEVELRNVHGSGRDGLITMDDVLNVVDFKRRGKPSYQMPKLPAHLAGEFEMLRGPRRAMSHTMTLSRDEIAMVTIFDDADLHAWPKGTDVTARAIRALIAGAKAEPGLNAVFDPSGPSRRVFANIDVGIAVDIGDKLLVPVVRDADKKSLDELRTEVAAVKKGAVDRTLTPEQLKDATITLSNFGTLAGRYATPLVVPPTVAILGTGQLRQDVVATAAGAVEVHRRMPLSLSFDHRCINGGEACRFIGAVIADLQKPS